MADKSREYRCAGAVDFINLKVTLDETRIEAGDTCDLTVQVTWGETPGGWVAPPWEVQVSATAIPGGGGSTVVVLGGINSLHYNNPNTTKEAHFLVSAGATPDPYDIEITVQCMTPLFPAQVFTFPVPEQTA